MVKTPDMPTTKDEDGKVIFPPIPLIPGDVQVGQGDLPETLGNVESIPYDTVVDLQTGTAVPDVPAEGGILGTLQGLWDWLKGILQQILQGILSIPASIAQAIKAILEALFVPEVGFLEDAFEQALAPLKAKMPIDVYMELLGRLKNVGAKELQDVQVVLYGQTVTILSWRYYKEHKAIFDNIIRGFAFVLLLLYNVNNVHKFFRNRGLLDGDSRGGGKEK